MPTRVSERLVAGLRDAGDSRSGAADASPPRLQVRIARHTERLEQVVAFYRDAIGLPEIGRFRDHDGYDGVFLEIPGTRAHLELTAGGAHGAPRPHPESLLVLYVESPRALRAIAGRLDAQPVPPANPYWAEHGLTYSDPDGFRVVLVPERWDGGASVPEVHVALHEGPRDRLRPLFELAEDSASALDGYIDSGRVLVARAGGEIVAHAQITETARPEQLEIKSLAVAPKLQRRGIGRALVEHAIALAQVEKRSTLVVATAAADVANLRFYQRLGFRMRAIERDAFTPAAGYAAGLEIDAIALRDRVWLDLRVAEAARSTLGP